LTLRKQLEEFNVFKGVGAFQFWDVEECCKIDHNVDFKALNSIRDGIHVIPVEKDLEVVRRKRLHLGNARESVGTVHNIRDSVDLEPSPSETEFIESQLTNLVSTARVTMSMDENLWTDGALLKSTLLLKEVLQWYIVSAYLSLLVNNRAQPSSLFILVFKLLGA